MEGKRRADSWANRDRIIETARRVLAVDPEASFHAIARAASVGQGTLYRNFASRDALLVTVYRAEIDALVERASTLLHEHEPLQAFRLWCELFARVGNVRHGVGGTLRAPLTDQDVNDSYWSLVRAVRTLLSACEESDRIRPGAEPEAVLTLLSCLLRIEPTAKSQSLENHVLNLIFAGLGAADAQQHRDTA